MEDQIHRTLQPHADRRRRPCGDGIRPLLRGYRETGVRTESTDGTVNCVYLFFPGTARGPEIDRDYWRAAFTIAEHLGVRAACVVGGVSGLVAVVILVLVGHRRRLVWTSGREW